MQEECHFDKFVQPTIDVAGGTRHPAPHVEPRALDPAEFDLLAKAAHHLPPGESRERRNGPPSVERMGEDEAQRRPETHRGGCGHAGDTPTIGRTVWALRAMAVEMLSSRA